MDTQTVFQAGNSLVVSIPKKVASALGWKKGQKLHIRHDPTEKTVTMGENPISETGLTPEYFAWKEQVFKQNAKLLSRLAKFSGAARSGSAGQ